MKRERTCEKMTEAYVTLTFPLTASSKKIKFKNKHPENLVINAILKGENITSEYLDISNFEVPSVWDAKRTDFTDNLKKFLVALNVTLSNSDSDDSIKDINEQCKQSLDNFNKYPNFENALAVFSTFGITNRKEEECFTILFKALNPTLFEIEPHFKGSSELINTGSLYANIFDIAGFFENYKRCGDQSINDLLRDETVVGGNIEDIRPDDVLIRKYSGSINCVKFVREDKPDNYPNHLKHPDFLKVVLVMRLSLSKTVRSLIRGELTPAHQEIYVIGATTDSSKTNLYKLCAIIEPTEEALSYNMRYHLQYLGSYNHGSSTTEFLQSRCTERMALISQLLCYCFDPWYFDLCGHVKSNHSSTTCSSASKSINSTTTFIIENTSYKFLKLHHISGDNQKSVTKGTIQKDGDSTVSIPAMFKNYSDKLVWEGNVLEEVQKQMLTLTLGMINDGAQIFMLAGDCDLQEYKKKHSGFTESEAILVLIDVLIQFEIIEERKFVHNDIKPRNIVLFKNNWYLIDYELSKKYTSLDTDGYCVRFGKRISDHSGTEGFYAPEKLSHGYIAPKGDVYSLGVSIQNLLDLNSEKGIFDDETKDDEIVSLSSILSKMTRDSCVERINSTECLKELDNLVGPGYIQSKKNHFLNVDYFTKNIISNQLP